ncbi:MAG: MerR family transcriptional regulator [Deltaproteobacteria bacterium]|jgi:DNA-binding transcriptional MerR regulator|nr:MerR family transcriptional regulator [Deltaproteobacteria bacterium]
MTIDSKTFTMADLASFSTFSKRTIRYYIQLGLVSRPIGEGRAAYYTAEHLRKLLQIKKYSDGGLSLEAIRTYLREDNEISAQIDSRKPGSIQQQSRVFLSPGLEFLITPEETGLTPEDLRLLVRGTLDLIRRVEEKSELERADPGAKARWEEGAARRPEGLAAPGEAAPAASGGADEDKDGEA